MFSRSLFSLLSYSHNAFIITYINFRQIPGKCEFTICEGSIYLSFHCSFTYLQLNFIFIFILMWFFNSSNNNLSCKKGLWIVQIMIKLKCWSWIMLNTPLATRRLSYSSQPIIALKWNLNLNNNKKISYFGTDIIFEYILFLGVNRWQNHNKCDGKKILQSFSQYHDGRLNIQNEIEIRKWNFLLVESRTIQLELSAAFC